MGFRWLVNAGLLILPVGTTVGILLGVDSHRHAAGQAPLFNDPNSNSNGDGTGGDSNSDGSTTIGGGGGFTGIDNGITISRYCQKQVGISPPSKGSRFTLNPNQWGYVEGTPGAMCMNVTAFHNNTYATVDTAPEFSVTWQYPPASAAQPVHAFPNAQLSSGDLPLQLQKMQYINFELQWTYGIGNLPVAATNENDMVSVNLNANVAIDMFLDTDKNNAQNSSKALYEVMVWFADFGPAAQPIGHETGIVTTQVLNGTTFNLYTGKNGLQQNVLTWVASQTTQIFGGDISPLLNRLSSLTNVVFPFSTLYLGHLGIGSEAFSVDTNVTFSMPLLSIDVGTS